MKQRVGSLKRFFFLNDKPLAKHIKKKERVQIKKVRNEKEVTTDTIEIKRVKRYYYK